MLYEFISREALRLAIRLLLKGQNWRKTTQNAQNRPFPLLCLRLFNNSATVAPLLCSQRPQSRSSCAPPPSAQQAAPSHQHHGEQRSMQPAEWPIPKPTARRGRASARAVKAHCASARLQQLEGALSELEFVVLASGCHKKNACQVLLATRP